MAAHLPADHFMRALDVEARAARHAALVGDDGTFALATEGIGNVVTELERLGVPVEEIRVATLRATGG